jgi:hypothetical protein
MPEAPRTRPPGSEVLLTRAGHVRARPAKVFEAIERRMRPDRDGESLFTADPAAFLVIAQGGWWYRGEYRVVPDEAGSNVEHSILNVAQTAHGLGRFTARRVLREAPTRFDRMLRELRLELE